MRPLHSKRYEEQTKILPERQPSRTPVFVFVSCPDAVLGSFEALVRDNILPELGYCQDSADA